jgi:cytoskeletal protein RodZ
VAKHHGMAQKRKKKKGRLKTLLFFILTPLIVWLLAFLIWFYWNPITRLLNKGKDQSKTRPKATRNIDKSERSNTPAEKRGQEQILDEERKKLDEILRKQRNHN